VKIRYETRRGEERRTSNFEILGAKSSLFPNVTNPEEPRTHRTKHNFTHVENHREFEFVIGETADVRQYYTTTQT
jgi:hypothetical protein